MLLDELHEYMNNLRSRIKFTIEIAPNNTINFLDLTIEASKESGFVYKIYRKPTNSGSIIPYTSHHCTPHKMAAFYSFTHRALLLPLTE